MEAAKEHVIIIKNELIKESNIDGNGVYNDWQALLKFNRNQHGEGFGDEDMAYEYIENVVASHIEKLSANQLKALSTEAVDELSELVPAKVMNHESVWMEGIQRLLQKSLFQLVYEEAGSELYFDEHDHEMDDVLEQMSFRIEQLKQHNDNKVSALAEELERFREMLYDYI